MNRCAQFQKIEGDAIRLWPSRAAPTGLRTPVLSGQWEQIHLGHCRSRLLIWINRLVKQKGEEDWGRVICPARAADFNSLDLDQCEVVTNSQVTAFRGENHDHGYVRQKPRRQSRDRPRQPTDVRLDERDHSRVCHTGVARLV